MKSYEVNSYIRILLYVLLAILIESIVVAIAVLCEKYCNIFVNSDYEMTMKSSKGVPFGV